MGEQTEELEHAVLCPLTKRPKNGALSAPTRTLLVLC